MTYISAKSVAQNNTYRSYTSGHYGTLNNQEDRFHINFEENLSFGIFSRLIRHKKQFVYQRDIPDTSYLCEACENAAMMAKVIRKKKSCHPINPTILSKNTCVIQMIQNAWKTSVKPLSLPKLVNHGTLIRCHGFCL